MAAEPSRGRATEVERRSAPEADAARALYERHAGQLYGFCLHRLGSREEAEDALQTTFLNAFRGLRRGVVPEAEAAWLFKIAENVCLTRRRSVWRRGRVESPSDMQVLQDVTPARQTDGSDELIPLSEALAAMPDSQRRAILLREWQGLSYKEISDEMDVSQSAVETLIFRARRSLANALETPWESRCASGQAGRRAFDLGSLLAGLKGLFAGATAAKVAVVAVAATGTAALAVAEARHESPPARRAQRGLGSCSGFGGAKVRGRRVRGFRRRAERGAWRGRLGEARVEAGATREEAGYTRPRARCRGRGQADRGTCGVGGSRGVPRPREGTGHAGDLARAGDRSRPGEEAEVEGEGEGEAQAEAEVGRAKSNAEAGARGEAATDSRKRGAHAALRRSGRARAAFPTAASAGEPTGQEGKGQAEGRLAPKVG